MKIERFSYALEMKTREQNRNNKRTEIEQYDWFVEQIQTLVAFDWLSERSREKTSHARELSRNQSILRFDVMLQHHWPIEGCLLHIRVFFGGKTKSPCFDLFIHWLIKQITNAYWNYFSKSYENRSNCVHIHSVVGSMIKEGCRWRIRKPSSLSVLKVVEASFILQVTSKSLEKHDSMKICILSFYMFHQAL